MNKYVTFTGQIGDGIRAILLPHKLPTLYSNNPATDHHRSIIKNNILADFMSAGSYRIMISRCVCADGKLRMPCHQINQTLSRNDAFMKVFDQFDAMAMACAVYPAAFLEVVRFMFG